MKLGFGLYKLMLNDNTIDLNSVVLDN